MAAPTSLYDLANRLRSRRRAIRILSALVVALFVGVVAHAGISARTTSSPIIAVALALAVWFVGAPRNANRERAWREERRIAAQEVGKSEGRDLERVPEGAARLYHGDVPALDAALEQYQLAVGAKLFPRFERLPEALYGDRVDACVRIDHGEPVVCFTPAMLAGFSASQLLAVIAHLLARAETTVAAFESAQPDPVLEADAAALLVTRDHVAMLSALEASRGPYVPLALSGDGECWFSEDQAVRRQNAEKQGLPEYRRVDRLEALRAQLGALSLDVGEAPAHVRLARLFDVTTGTLTETARDGLRD